MLSFETREYLTACGLAAIGAVRSIPELIDPHPELRTQQDTSRAALLCLAAAGGAVVAWNKVSSRRLSEGADTAPESRRTLTGLVIGGVTAHILNTRR